jgi:hypothetical protein
MFDSPQLRAALVRSLLPAIVAAVLAYFGADLATEDAAQGAAEAAVDNPDTEVTGNNDEEVVDDAKSEGEDDAGSQQAIAAAITGASVLVLRGAGEGIYDTQRNTKGNVKPGDVTPNPETTELEEAKPRGVPGIWVQKEADPDENWYYVLSVYRPDDDKMAVTS